MIREGKVKKNKGENFKGKLQAGNGKGKKAPQNLPPKKDKVSKYDTCFKCRVVGHWKSNFPKYLVELKNKKVGEGSSGISIFMIEMGLFTFSSNTWGFRKSRELNTDEMVLHVGNGARVTTQAIGHFNLNLPSGLYLTLNNVCLITSITRNIVSFSCLRKFGFNLQFVDNNIHSFLDGIFYFEARPINEIYELNLDDISIKPISPSLMTLVVLVMCI
uniref:Uncharacterized protein n=1 Tax=Lactuca sativa TaxID=4236 RepID=A0A9R1XK47_LACSA|nr:hypothetical protein LSAT_V11C300145530 [Lactuca sativa]